MTLYIAGEDINAESSVVIATDGKVYAAGSRAGVMIGEAVEQIREGFRVIITVPFGTPLSEISTQPGDPNNPNDPRHAGYAEWKRISRSYGYD